MKTGGVCTNQELPRRGGAVPNPVWGELKWLLAFAMTPVTSGTPLILSFFCRAAH